MKSTDDPHSIVKRCWSKENLQLLIPIIRLLTIHMPGKRYDTLFFLPGSGTRFVNFRYYFKNGAKALTDLDNLITDNESVSYIWNTASDIIKLFNESKIILFPPQLIILGCFKGYNSIDQLTKAAMTIEEVEPTLLEIDKKNQLVLLPYDKDYDISKRIEKEPETESKADLVKSLARIRKLTAGKNVTCRFGMNNNGPHSL